MKLYATTVNEKRKQEGQGGNEYLITQLKRGNKNVYDIYFDTQKLTVFDIEQQKEVLRLEQKKGEVRCNNCWNIWNEWQLHDIEDMKACPECKTDEYLMDLVEQKGKQKKGESFIDTIEKHKQNAFENGIY